MLCILKSTFTHSTTTLSYLCVSVKSQAEELERHRQQLQEERRQFRERARHEVEEMQRRRGDETWTSLGQHFRKITTRVLESGLIR